MKKLNFIFNLYICCDTFYTLLHLYIYIYLYYVLYIWSENRYLISLIVLEKLVKNWATVHSNMAIFQNAHEEQVQACVSNVIPIQPFFHDAFESAQHHSVLTITCLAPISVPQSLSTSSLSSIVLPDSTCPLKCSLHLQHSKSTGLLPHLVKTILTL